MRVGEKHVYVSQLYQTHQLMEAGALLIEEDEGHMGKNVFY